LFNCERCDERRHPQQLYRVQSLGLKFFEQDLNARPSPLDLLLPQLPEILALADKIRKGTPAAAKEVGFEFGRMCVTKNKRAGADKYRDTPLPFIGEVMRHRVPNGWLFPMLAAFRANVKWDLATGVFKWLVPIDELLPQVLLDLVRVCVSEHRDNRTPELVGKRESAYQQCYDKIRLNLALAGRLTT
jgi:hypothetical protein